MQVERPRHRRGVAPVPNEGEGRLLHSRAGGGGELIERCQRSLGETLRQAAVAAGAVLREEGTPIDDHRASAAYRTAMLGTSLRKFHAQNAKAGASK